MNRIIVYLRYSWYRHHKQQNLLAKAFLASRLFNGIIPPVIKISACSKYQISTTIGDLDALVIEIEKQLLEYKKLKTISYGGNAADEHTYRLDVWIYGSNEMKYNLFTAYLYISKLLKDIEAMKLTEQQQIFINRMCKKQLVGYLIIVEYLGELY